MPRLYYPPPEEPGLLAGKKKKRVDTSDLAKKVALLVPSELITAYSALITFSSNARNPGLHAWLFGISFLVCLVLTPIYLYRMRTGDRPIRNHLIVSTIAFAVWAYATSGWEVLPGDFYDPALASFGLLIFSLVTAAVPLDK